MGGGGWGSVVGKSITQSSTISSLTRPTRGGATKAGVLDRCGGGLSRIKDRAETTSSDQVAMRGYELLGKATGLLRPEGPRVEVNFHPHSIGNETRRLIKAGKLTIDELGGDAEPRLWLAPGDPDHEA